MSVIIHDTEIEGLKIIKPHIWSDDRGTYSKFYEKNAFECAGISVSFSESSDILSKKGVIRGLHYQTVKSQAKLVRVIKGKAFDVALDLRDNSSSFGCYHVELLEEGDKAIYIPEGFAHGFMSLEENTIFSYMCSGEYLPNYCGGIIWNDFDLKIPWPLEEYEIENVILTEKDKNWPSVKRYRDAKFKVEVM